MRKPTTYDFTILTDEDRDEVLASIVAASWETALLDRRMIRFDRRPRFTQSLRHEIRERNLVLRTLTTSEGTYLWLEDATEAA